MEDRKVVFDRQIRIEAGVDTDEALICVRSWLRENEKEERGDGYKGLVGFVMKHSGNSIWVYRTPTAYIVRKN